MAVIAVIAGEEESRRKLRLAIEELGHRAAMARDLRGGLELLRSERPKALVVVQAPGDTLAESALVELEREAPLLPLVVALSERKAARAVELMKAGAFEVVPPPWTPEGLSSCLSKALRCRGTSLEPLRRPVDVRKGLWVYAVAACVLFAAAVSTGLFLRERRLARMAAAMEKPTSWELPYSHPSGLAFDGKSFWIADWFSGSVSRHAREDMREVWTRHLPKEVPGAIAFAADSLWVASGPRRIVEHMLDDELTVLGRIRDAAPQTVGMAYDGLYLWTCDSKTRRLHKRILDKELSVVSRHKYPGGRPAALAFDGRALWSLDSANWELLRHELDHPEKVTLRLPLERYRAGVWKPTGLVFDGKAFWTVAEPAPGRKGRGRIFLHEVPEPFLERIKGR